MFILRAIIILFILSFFTPFREKSCADDKNTLGKPPAEVAVALIQIPPDSGVEKAAAGFLNYESVGKCLKALTLQQGEEEFTPTNVVHHYRGMIIVIFVFFAFLALGTVIIFRLLRKLRFTHAQFKKEAAERALIESELKRSEAKYRSLFESTPDAIMVTDKQGFTDCNSATLKMFGCSSKEEFISMSPGQLSPPQQPDGRDSQEASVKYIEEALTKGSVFFEWVHSKKNGTTFPAEVMLSNLEIEGKRIAQALVRDVTSRKQIEAEREHLINELQEALGHVKTLKGLLPICANCKKVRDDKGYWNQIEIYVQKHTDASFTHGLCPDCVKKLYPNLYP